MSQLTTNKPLRKPTKKQQHIIDQYLSGLSGSEIARSLGVSHAAVSQVINKPHVEAIIAYEMRKKLAHGSVKAAHSMIKLAESAKSEYVQYQASADLLDRAGYKAPELSMGVVQGDVTINIDLS